MRKKILAFVFAAALLVATAVPLLGGASTASAGPQGHIDTPAGCVDLGGGPGASTVHPGVRSQTPIEAGTCT